MKERPMLMSGPMVRAILAGTKTQTRRIAPIRDLNIIKHPGDMVTWSVSFLKAVKGVLSSHSGGKFNDLQASSIIASQFNPYGQPGDRLWVRETFAIEHSVEPDQPLPHSDGRPIKRRPDDDHEGAHPLWMQAHYRATDPAPELVYEDGPAGGREDEIGVRWTPSIHMPRWASRITLEITGVRVERLQDISADDAKAEGCALECISPTGDDSGSAIHGPGGFRALWSSINGAESWGQNPWVWVIQFQRTEVRDGRS